MSLLCKMDATKRKIEHMPNIMVIGKALTFKSKTKEQVSNRKQETLGVSSHGWMGGRGKVVSMEQKTTSRLQIGHAEDGYQWG